MALNSMGLGFTFTAKDLASGPIGRIDRNFRTLDGTTRQTSRGMAENMRTIAGGVTTAAVATGAAATGLFALASSAGQFEQGLVAVGAVTRATSEEMTMLQDAASQAAMATQFSPKQAVDGLTSLATAGQTAAQATASLEPVLNLAAGSLGQLGVAGAAEAVVGTLNAYGMQAEQATDVTDKLLRITQLTNFQTRDFEVGLSKAAAAGGTFGQELDDVLILMGLLRNRNIDASSSSTAVREAFRRMASDQNAQQALMKAGVRVFDKQTGAMRKGIDVMSEFAAKSVDMTEKERNAIINRAFGARGMLAFNAVQEAMYTRTLPNGTKEVVRGMEAISAMRKEMKGATGTAKEFKDKIEDTFEGQKVLLKGVLETFVVTIGAPLAKALKPGLTAIRQFVVRAIKWFEALPQGFRDTIGQVAKVIVGLAGALTALAGTGAALGGIVFGLKLLVGVLGALASLSLPVLGTLAALAAAGSFLYLAWEENLGGFRDFVLETWETLKLTWRAFVDLFKRGGFSKAVWDELSKAENEGLRKFVIGVYMFVHRVRRFLVGLWEGWQSTLVKLRPVFDRFKQAIVELAEVWSEMVGSIAGDATKLPSDKYASFGATVGTIAAEIVGVFVRIGTVMVKFQKGAQRVFGRVLTATRPVFEWLWDSLVQLGESFKGLLVTLGIVDEGAIESGGIWETLGEIWGWIVAVPLPAVAAALGGLVKIATWVIDAITWLVEAIRGDLGPLAEFLGTLFMIPIAPILVLIKAIGWLIDAFKWLWAGTKAVFWRVIDFFVSVINTAIDAIQTLFDLVRDTISAIPESIRPAALDDLAGALDISGYKIESIREDTSDLSPVLATPGSIAEAFGRGPEAVMPAAVGVETGRGPQDRMAEALHRMVDTQTQTLMLMREQRKTELIVDGEKLGEISDRRRDDAAARAQHVPTVR